MQNRVSGRRAQAIGLVTATIVLIAGATAYSTRASVGQSQPANTRALQHDGEPHATPATLPAGAPSLLEILQSAQSLSDAGLLPAQDRPLIDILESAQALGNAGLLPGHPPLIEVLQSAQALANAGLLPGYPSMLEILTAAKLLAGSDPAAEQHAVAAPPLAPVEPPEPAPRPQPVASGWYDDGYIARIVGLVNGQRAGAGLPLVADEGHLARSASGYAKVLSDNRWFSHTGPDGSTFVQRIEAAGMPFTVPFGEILAWGTESWSAESLVQAWMNSPAHRSEILSPLYTRAGASCYFTSADGVTVYCVIDFAG